MKVYEYKGCGTCKKALRFLDENGVSYKKVPIRETPPTASEIKKVLKYLGGDHKKLFNTSGQDYRQMNLKERVGDLSQAEVIELLTGNGNLIKRPFLISSEWGVVGFKEDVWKEHLLA